MTMNTPLMHRLEWAAKLHLLEKSGPNHEYDQEAIKVDAQKKVIAFVESGAFSETLLTCSPLQCTPPLREKPLPAKRGSLMRE